MKLTRCLLAAAQTRRVLSGQNLLGAAILLVGGLMFAAPSRADSLRVMKTGLGSGTITEDVAAPGIDCGSDCDETYASVPVVLRATAAPGSTFAGWGGDCSGTMATCTVDLSVARAVRADFSLSAAIPPITDFTPAGISAYLAGNPAVNTAARFLSALPAEFKQDWILMSRSESLQTGIAAMPRILLPSANAELVFTLGTATDSSYPGAHPNAIEFMQWDATQKNFRFHEIVLDSIPAMNPVPVSSPPEFRFPARSRGVSVDDAKCFACHSTRNILNRGTTPGTDGVPPGTVKAKSKPNWDTYDSWGGMLPFNRDRIYQGSVEAAAFRAIFNLWNWRANDQVRSIIEQLELQPSHVPSTSPHSITRNMDDITDSGHIQFGFDSLPPISTANQTISYSFAGPTTSASAVVRGGRYVTLRHSNPIPTPNNDDYSNPGSDEGRGVQLFDLLGGLDGQINPQRIADELVSHRVATGNAPIDPRPIALAINTPGCLSVSGTSITATSSTALSVNLAFFAARSGGAIDQLIEDTRQRARGLTRRKADIQRLDLFRTNGSAVTDDPYLLTSSAANGLIQEHGAATSSGNDTSIPRIRQEVFPRPIDLGSGDSTAMGGVYVDRELASNFQTVALYRYFLEPLGVSVDKWSMGVRGRSRTYTFADVFGSYESTFAAELKASLGISPTLSSSQVCDQLILMVNSTLGSLPAPNATPTYTDIQRIFNKSCIECHGGLGYPPYESYGTSLDLTEDESPPAGDRRLTRSHGMAMSRTSAPTGPSGTDVSNSFLYQRITNNGTLAHPYNPATTNEYCPNGIMPCGGPPLSRTDIETIRRWIIGGRPSTEGDPHIKTVDGVNYDLQSAGEFVLLHDAGMELQARQTAVTTAGPLGPNAHTGLVSCVSVNTAVALRVGRHRVSYQPEIRPALEDPDAPSGGQSDRLLLRIDGKVTALGDQAVALPSGGRILRTSVPDGIQIQYPGGTSVAITPQWWAHHRIWYMNINVRHARATSGVMGAISPGGWLPALPDGSHLGPRPADLHERYVQLYETFADAWRVTDATSLFDYEPGFSAADFAVDGWPAESPTSCAAPPQPGGPARTPAQTPAAQAEAEELCSEVTAADRRENCVQDVMATGEPGFAETYLLTERIEAHRAPAPPVLVLPENNSAVSAETVNFIWTDVPTVADGDVRYRHCLWNAAELYDFNNCIMIGRSPLSKASILYAILVGLIGLVLFVALLYSTLRYKRILLLLLVVAMLPALLLAIHFGRTSVVSTTLVQLEPGKVYFWKAVAEDDQGGTAESQTRRFTTE